MNPNQISKQKKLSTTPPHLLTCTVAKILDDYNPTTTHARFEQINTDSDNCHVSGFFRMTKSGSIMMNKMWKVILRETKHKCVFKKIHWLCFPNSQQHWNVSWVNLGIPPSVTKWTCLLSAVAHRQPPWFEAKNICPTNNKELKQKTIRWMITLTGVYNERAVIGEIELKVMIGTVLHCGQCDACWWWTTDHTY